MRSGFAARPVPEPPHSDVAPPSNEEMAPRTGDVDSARKRPYSWPLRPTNLQHPIYGAFNDPRIAERSKTFHFGVDLAAADGSPVVAVEGGAVRVTSTTTVIVNGDRGRSFAYWHVVPAVLHGQEIQAGAVVGRIARGHGHVHFAEWSDGSFRNPLRPGALEPFVDTSAPAITTIGFFRRGRVVPGDRVRGTIAIIAEAFETPPRSQAGRWRPDIPVTPALLRWRMLDVSRQLAPWRTAADFRDELLPPSEFSRVYAPGTKKGGRRAPGRYRFYLAREWDSTVLLDGRYRLEVVATDIRGNRAIARLPFDVRNGRN